MLCIKPKKQKHKQSGCEGKCRSPWNSFTVFGVTDASVCYFRWSLESDNVKHISSCICKSLHPLFAKFPLKKETLFVVIVHNIQTRSEGRGQNLVQDLLCQSGLTLNKKARLEWSALSPGQFLIHFPLSVLPITLIQVVPCHIHFSEI